MLNKKAQITIYFVRRGGTIWLVEGDKDQIEDGCFWERNIFNKAKMRD
jgi:hypothetical protein